MGDVTILAWVPVAQSTNIDAALTAVKGQQYNLTINLTTDNPAVYESPLVYKGMHDAGGNPADSSLYSTCKAGTLPSVDQKWGNPITWGENGVISEEDALAAFATLTVYTKDSEEDDTTFKNRTYSAAGVSTIPVPE